MKFIGVIAGISGEVIVKELKKLGYSTFLISGRDNDSGMNISDKSLTIDLKEKEKIYEILKENMIEKVIFGTGHVLAFYLAEYLKEKGIKVSINPKSSLLAKDKFLYKEELKKYNILTPEYICLEVDDEIKLDFIKKKIKIPCVVKSTIDLLLPKKANNEEELIKYIEELKKLKSPILIEKFIEGVDLTIPVLSNNTEKKAILVSYYSKAKECKLKGFKTTAEIKKLDNYLEESLMKFAEEVIKKTDIIGMARLDIILGEDKKIYVLECNSVMVTGIHPKQLEYGIKFLEKENINFAELTVKNALKIFEN